MKTIKSLLLLLFVTLSMQSKAQSYNSYYQQLPVGVAQPKMVTLTLQFQCDKSLGHNGPGNRSVGLQGFRPCHPGSLAVRWQRNDLPSESRRGCCHRGQRSHRPLCTISTVRGFEQGGLFRLLQQHLFYKCQLPPSSGGQDQDGPLLECGHKDRSGQCISPFNQLPCSGDFQGTGHDNPGLHPGGECGDSDSRKQHGQCSLHSARLGN